MDSEATKVARDWGRVENGQAQPECVDLWDAINEVVAASGGRMSCTNVARQKAVVRVHQAVTAIVAASLNRATKPAPEPVEPVTDEGIEQAIVAAADANFAVGEWDRDTCDEPFDVVSGAADAANQELRKLFQRAAEDRDGLRERAEKAEAEVANLRVRLRVYQQIDAGMAKSRLREMREWTQKNVDPADGQVAMLEEFDRLIGDSAEKRAESPTMFMERLDRDLMALAKHPGSNLYHVKDNDRPMFVLADSWGEAVAAYEAMVRSENDMEPDEEVEILGVDFVANRRDILVAPIDVEAKR
jgi:hypothetical protein